MIKARAGLKEVLKRKNVILQVIAIDMPFVDYSVQFLSLVSWPQQFRNAAIFRA